MAPPKALQKQLQGNSAASAGGGDAAALSSTREGNMMEILCLPFNLLRCPQMSLRIPRPDVWQEETRGTGMKVFFLLFAAYSIIMSGIVYDVINQPPSMGSERDPATGAIRAVAFMPNKINGQYLLEGFAAGSFFAVGGFGFMLLDMSNSSHSMTANNRWIMIVAGLISIIGAFSLCQLCIRIKIPNYLVGSSY